MTTTQPGWYPDPAGSPRSRWWDGTAWTEHFYDAATGAPVVVLRAPEGTKAYNPWIWLVVFLPYLTLPLLFTLDLSSMFSFDSLSDPSASTRAQLSLLTSPAYLAMTLGSFVLAGAVVFCAYRDGKVLQAAGVPKPFPWAWAFASLAGYPVYAIGRAVVTKRRTGHGSGVLWAVIGMFVLALVVSLIWVGTMMTTLMQQIANYSY
ncbi:MAG: DUF2510 domain-containing protein [Rhodoglobus sp.]